jgi:hypothetical protein
MTTKLSVALAFVVLMSVVVLGNATATTEPAVQINIRVKLTDTSLTMSRYDARRGWGGIFIVKNLGKKPHVLDVGGLQTKTIKPGGTGRLEASFETRGRYPFQVTLNSAGVKHKGIFVVR